MLAILVALGESDCETVGTGVLAQPVNAVSSLAFTVAGLALIPWVGRATGIERRLRTAFVVLMAATGVGSFLYHGPQSAGSHFLHDITFLMALATIAVANLAAAIDWDERWVWATLGTVFAVCSLALVLVPGSTNVFTGLSVVAVIVAHVLVRRRHRPHRQWSWLAGMAMIVALIFFGLGRTDGPLCDAESLFQGHALWHVFAALALTWYFVATSEARTATR